MLKLILCAPEFDIATVHSYKWACEVFEYAMDKGFDVLFLEKENAVRFEVEEWLYTFPNTIFVFYDHGDETSLIGNDRVPVLDLSNNRLLKNRICYSMACLSAKHLGADSYHRYGTTYWGSIENISFTTDALEQFKQALNFGIKLWIDGEADWNKILDKTLENDDEIIDELIVSGKIFAAALLREDRDARRVWTDKTPPPDQSSTCIFRRALIKLFGQRAWRIRKSW